MVLVMPSQMISKDIAVISWYPEQTIGRQRKLSQCKEGRVILAVLVYRFFHFPVELWGNISTERPLCLIDGSKQKEKVTKVVILFKYSLSLS